MAWTEVATLQDLAVGEAKQVLLAEPVCVVRVAADEVLAVHDTCSHARFSLAEGWLDGRTIECALHGSAFDLDTGRPQSLPAVLPVPTYAARITPVGAVEVDLDQQTNDAPVPRH